MLGTTNIKLLVPLTLQMPRMDYRNLAHGLPQSLHYNTITVVLSVILAGILDWAALLWRPSYVG